MRFPFGSKERESDSEDELFSEEQEVSLLMLLPLCLLLRDFDRPLSLLLLEDLRLDEPRDEDTET